MAPLKVEQYVVGPVQTNCYFAVNDETKEMILIDPGANADRLIQIIEEEKLNPVAILLTHGHFDHAGGAAEVAARFGIKVYAGEHERETLDDPKLNLSGWTGVETTYHADVFLRMSRSLISRDFISGYCLHRDTRWVAAVIILPIRMPFFPGIRCSPSRSEGRISRREALRR